MASSDQPPCPTCAPGRSGFSEPVCPPLLRPEQLPLRPVLWTGGVGWENGGTRSGQQRSKRGVSGWGSLLPCFPPSPLSPHSPSSPQPCPSCPMTVPIPSSPFLQFWARPHPLPLDPHPIPPPSPPSLKDLPSSPSVLGPGVFSLGSPAPQGLSLDPGSGIEGRGWPGPACLKSLLQFQEL